MHDWNYGEFHEIICGGVILLKLQSVAILNHDGST